MHFAPEQKSRGFLDFSRHRAGSIAILFAVVIPILLGFMGLGFDAARAHFVKQRLSKAVDAAVLAAAASRGTDDERRRVGQNVFAANYGTGILAPTANLNIAFDTDGNVDVTVDADMAAPFASFLGFDLLHLSFDAGAMRPVMDIEVVLVVDVSGSMRANSSGGMSRMEALRSAAHTLLQTMQANAPGSAMLRFAIVPYNVNVNVGTANAHFVDQTTHPLFSGTSWNGCVLERRPPYHLSNDYNPLATNGSGKWHAYVWPPEPDTLTGGFDSCDNPSNGTNLGYASIGAGTDPNDATVPGPNYNCARSPIVPLTDDVPTIEAAIDALDWAYNEGTLIAPGVTWGYRVLTPGEPFSGAAPFSQTSHKVMVVMTDGQQVNDRQNPDCQFAGNTASTYGLNPPDFGLAGTPITGTGPSDIWTAYGYIMDSNPLGKAPAAFTDQADELLVEACNEAKDFATASGGNLDIFTITFTSSANPSSSVATAMQNCASNPANYYHAPNAGALEDAFAEIGEIVSTVTLVR